MADNHQLVDGNGDLITMASDEVTGVKHSRVKVQWGADGAAVDASASDPFPVRIAVMDDLAEIVAPDGNLATLGATTDAAASTDTATASLIALFKRLLQRLTTLLPQSGGRLDVAVGAALPAGTAAIGKLAANSGVDIGDVDVASIAAGETHIGEVGGRSRVVVASFNRPNDTTTYTAGDAINAAASGSTTPTIAAARVNNGSGIITSVTVVISKAQTLKADLELWLFGAALAATSGNDNSAFAPTNTEIATLLPGVPIRLGNVPVVGSGNVAYTASGLAIPFQAGAATQNILWQLVVRNAYVPTAQETFTLILGVLQD